MYKNYAIQENLVCITKDNLFFMFETVFKPSRYYILLHLHTKQRAYTGTCNIVAERGSCNTRHL